MARILDVLSHWRGRIWAVIRDYPTTLIIRASSFRKWYPPKSFPDGDLRPVVILPGVYETWHYLRPVAEALNRAGHPIHIVTQIGFNRRPIPSSAEKVWRALVDRDVHGVAIVAHSKGGLIGKQLLAFHDKEHRIDRMIAIATPFGGSSMSLLGPTPAMRAFRPDDPVIAALVAEAAVDAHITSIYPSFDPHIPEGSKLAGARNIELPVEGHFRILFYPELPDLVLSEVEREMEREAEHLEELRDELAAGEDEDDDVHERGDDHQPEDPPS